MTHLLYTHLSLFTRYVSLPTICAAILALGTTVQALANYEFLGDVTEASGASNAIDLASPTGDSLHVRFVQSGIVHLWLTRDRRPNSKLDRVVLLPDTANGIVKSSSDSSVSLGSDILTVMATLSPCQIIVRDNQGELLQEDNPGFAYGWDGNEVRTWKSLAPGERFFGLGLKTGDLNRRGREWVMWNSDIPGYDRNTDPLYESIPFYIGLRDGREYGVYFNNSYRTRFNFGAGNDRYVSFAAEDGMLDYYVIAGPKISDVLERYAALTGHMPLPPVWSLGYQQCRWSYFPDKNVESLARSFRERKIPADVIYLDIHHMDGYRVFTWDRDRFSQPDRLLKSLERDGFKVITIIDPGVKVDSAYSVAREGLRNNHFVRYPDSSVYTGEVWPGRSYFPDFSNADTRDWWGNHVGKWRLLGVRGIWNDMNEPAVWGQAFPTETIFNDDGMISSHKKLHNQYGSLMARATYEGLVRAKPDERPFILTRAAFAGIQRYSAVWTGDNVASEEHLELGIRMMLGEGMSGVPFVGTDIGGFMGSPTPELFARWMQVGAFSPLCRTHTHFGSNLQEPWSYGERIEEIARKYITLRYRLMPYLYTTFYQASERGYPVLRPVFWYDQDDATCFDPAYQHQFYVGDHLLAAPVTRAGTSLLRVYLPKGNWVDWNSGRMYEGGAPIVVDTPLETMPLFLREGACLPMRDSVQFTDERPIREMTIELFPPFESTAYSEIYEDDGNSFDYKKGKYRITSISQSREERRITLTHETKYDGLKLPGRKLVYRLHAVDSPSKISMDDEPVSDFNYDTDKQTLTIRLSAESARHRLLIEY